MPITLTFDIDEESVQDNNDRTRIILCFRRFGWEHIGGSAWRDPALGTENVSEDWFNHVIPALMYFRSIVEHAGIRVTVFTLDAHSEAGYRGNANPALGNGIAKSEEIAMYAPSFGRENAEAILSESRLRRFVSDAAASLE